jgi:hypothetical protein
MNNFHKIIFYIENTKMKHQKKKIFCIGFLCAVVVQILLQPLFNDYRAQRLRNIAIEKKMKSAVSVIYDYYQYINIEPQEMGQIVGKNMNWRISLFMYNFFYEFKKLDIEKSWNDKQNYLILDKADDITWSSTTGDMFSYILILPNNNEELDFILLESSLNGRHWAEPREIKTMTINELLELNREDRKKQKIHYCTPAFDFGIIRQDKDFKKLLEKLKCDEFLVMQ